MAKRKRGTRTEPQANRKSSKGNEGRLAVLKTYKLYIGGAFPRTESGRYYSLDVGGRVLGNLCRASRKDLRNAVAAARAAQPGWAGRTAYNRSQILYRIAEMLEGRCEQFVEELTRQGCPRKRAQREVAESIDRTVYYAGWCDKFQQIFSSVNPVASSHFNFSILEPTGVVFAATSEDDSLLGLLSLVLPIIAGGNTCVALASNTRPLCAITLGEALATSDLPGGVVNLLTGYRDEIVPHAARHMDVNAVALDRPTAELERQTRELAVDNVKRVRILDTDWQSDSAQNPYLIQDFCEVKTTWHPIETIGPDGSGY